MSYRAFKRLLGETSLERKCRFLLGGFILLLITGSFWLYAKQTEHLAYEQIITTSRLLMIQIVDETLASKCFSESKPGSARPGADDQPSIAGPREFRAQWEKSWSESLKKYYQLSIFRPGEKGKGVNKADAEESIAR